MAHTGITTRQFLITGCRPQTLIARESPGAVPEVAPVVLLGGKTTREWQRVVRRRVGSRGLVHRLEMKGSGRVCAG